MPHSIHLVFCGTPQFAVPTLERLVDMGFAVDLAVTQPDRPRGRGMEMAFSPIKQRARELGLPVIQPDRIKNNDEFRTQLATLKPDAISVVGYGRIIPQWMIELPPLGNINLHASLLPKYRGAAPIQWAIASGESISGVTTMRIDAGLDTGNMLLRREEPIAADDTAITLGARLAEMGGPLMLETLRGLAAGTIYPTPQDNAEATLAPLLKKEDGLVDFRRTAAEIYNRFRGFQPWPGAYTQFRGKNLKLVALRSATLSGPQLAPGEIAMIPGDRLLVGTGGENGAIELLEIQPENRNAMTAADFA